MGIGNTRLLYFKNFFLQDSSWRDPSARMETAEIPDAAETAGPDNEDEITSLLLRHEKRSTTQKTTVAHNDSESDK